MLIPKKKKLYSTVLPGQSTPEVHPRGGAPSQPSFLAQMRVYHCGFFCHLGTAPGPLRAAVAQMGNVTRRAALMGGGGGYMTLTPSRTVALRRFLRYPHSSISLVSLRRTRVCSLLLRVKVAIMAVAGACARQLCIRVRRA